MEDYTHAKSNIKESIDSYINYSLSMPESSWTNEDEYSNTINKIIDIITYDKNEFWNEDLVLDHLLIDSKIVNTIKFKTITYDIFVKFYLNEYVDFFLDKFFYAKIKVNSLYKYYRIGLYNPITKRIQILSDSNFSKTISLFEILDVKYIIKLDEDILLAPFLDRKDLIYKKDNNEQKESEFKKENRLDGHKEFLNLYNNMIKSIDDFKVDLARMKDLYIEQQKTLEKVYDLINSLPKITDTKKEE